MSESPFFLFPFKNVDPQILGFSKLHRESEIISSFTLLIIIFPWFFTWLHCLPELEVIQNSTAFSLAF